MTFATNKVPRCETLGQTHPTFHLRAGGLFPAVSFPHIHGLPSINCMIVRYYENKNVNYSFVAIDFIQ